MIIFGFAINEENVQLKTHRFRPITEEELYMRDHEKLKHLFCPHCEEQGFMYRDFVSITCKACEWHNSFEEVKEYNKVEL
jgi:RNase P subunit RPR2